MTNIDHDALARRIAERLMSGRELASKGELKQSLLSVIGSDNYRRFSWTLDELSFYIALHLREALPTSETHETGWLIERNRERGPEWATFWKFGVVWTKDSIQACRFCRREDAEQSADGVDYDTITEHRWP